MECADFGVTATFSCKKAKKNLEFWWVMRKDVGRKKKVSAIWQEARQCVLEMTQRSFNYKISSMQFKEFLHFCEKIYLCDLSSIIIITYVIIIFSSISPNPSSIPQNALHTHKFLMGVIYTTEIREKTRLYRLEKQQAQGKVRRSPTWTTWVEAGT